VLNGFWISTDGTIRYVSPSVEKVLGYPVSELAGKKIFEPIHPDDFAATYHCLINTLQSAEITPPLEFRYPHKDNSWRTLEAISQPFIDNAATTQIIVNARDITERKRLDEIRLALEREKELSILKTRFFSMASHEFRTPLSTALAAAQVLENSPSTWNRSLAKIQSTPPQPSPRVRGGGKIILVFPLNKGGLRAVNLTFARVLMTPTNDREICIEFKIL
jgi:PAS domain S-box-containing protein